MHVSTLCKYIPILIIHTHLTLGRDVSIVDAEEMEYPKNTSGNEDPSHRAAILKKIELHQKVFPQHRVVGWYRVQKHDENSMNVDVMPSEEDLVMNQTEMARYCSGSHGSENATISDDDVEAPLFVLMNASKTVEESSSGDKKPSSTSNNASEEMEVDEELPLAVYETLSTAESSAVFVNADFELDTPEPERIAVEKVFKTQPSKSAVALAAKDAADASTVAAAAENKEEEVATAGGDDSRKTGKKSKKDDDKQEKKPSKPPFTRGPTELDSTEDSLQSSIRAMNIRMNVLLEFLQKVKAGEIASDDTLLRSVDGLVRQLPLVLAALEEGQAASTGRKPLRELEHEYSNTMLLTYLAAVAKTAKSVHVYSEKFNSVAGSSNGGNIGRRGGPPMMY